MGKLKSTKRSACRHTSFDTLPFCLTHLQICLAVTRFPSNCLLSKCVLPQHAAPLHAPSSNSSYSNMLPFYMSLLQICPASTCYPSKSPLFKFVLLGSLVGCIAGSVWGAGTWDFILALLVPQRSLDLWLAAQQAVSGARGSGTSFLPCWYHKEVWISSGVG